MENTSEKTISKKVFNSHEEVIQDSNFLYFLNKNIDDLKRKRNLRPTPKPGYVYKRDWYDRMSEKNQVNIDFFLKNIIDIWNRKSMLSSEIRSVVESICNKSLYETYKKYNEQTK